MLIPRLQRRFPGLPDPAFVEDAVHQSLINYFTAPSKYDPEKLALGSYLLMAARSDLLNLIKQHKRRQSHQPVSLDVVELAEFESEHLRDESGDPAARDLDPDDFEAKLTEALPDQRDREIAHLMMDGVRSTTEYARRLRVTDTPEDEQRKLVKRHKDRIIKRLQRARMWTHDC